MAEKEVIRQVVTKETLVQTLRDLGVTSDMILEVHSSLSSLGFVVGGARTVVDALMETVGPNGTIMMASQVGTNSEPSAWKNPPVSPDLYRQVRDELPPYDPKFSDLYEMGAVAENFRQRPGVVFSGHPSVSYAAWGRHAQSLCNHQSVHFPLAEESPSARLYELRGYVLLIGVDLDKCTCMHLAEYRTESRPICIEGAAFLNRSGERIWKKYLNFDLDSSEFVNVRPQLLKKNMLRETTLGDCTISLVSAVNAVDEATKYFKKTSVYDLYR